MDGSRLPNRGLAGDNWRMGGRGDGRDGRLAGKGALLDRNLELVVLGSDCTTVARNASAGHGVVEVGAEMVMDAWRQKRYGHGQHSPRTW